MDFAGFETQDTQEILGPKEVSVNNSEGACGKGESYMAELKTITTPKGEFYSYAVATSTLSSGWVSLGFNIFWDTLGIATSQATFFRFSSPNPHWRLDWQPDGDVLIYDANGTLKKTISGVLEDDVCYLFEAKFELGDSSDLFLRLNGRVIANLTGMDTLGANSDAELFFTNTGSQVDVMSVFVDSYYFKTDDGTDIGDEQTFCPGAFYYIGGPYISDTQTAAGDFGDTLDAGTWGDTQEYPLDTSNFARYSTAAGTGEGGGVTMDDSTNGGFVEDEDVATSTQIDGVYYAYRYKTNTSGFLESEFFPKYGRQVQGSETTDNTTLGSSQQSSGASVFLKLLFNDTPGTGSVPAKDEYFQIGYRSVFSGFFGSLDTDLQEMWTAGLICEPHYATATNTDGSVSVTELFE